MKITPSIYYHPFDSSQQQHRLDLHHWCHDNLHFYIVGLFLAASSSLSFTPCCCPNATICWTTSQKNQQSICIMNIYEGGTILFYSTIILAKLSWHWLLWEHSQSSMQNSTISLARILAMAAGEEGCNTFFNWPTNFHILVWVIHLLMTNNLLKPPEKLSVDIFHEIKSK